MSVNAKTQNANFNKSYKRHILPRYKHIPNPPTECAETDWSINEDQKAFPIITIDPQGCIDADDGFTIYEANGEMYLGIHIADPTAYMDPHSELFQTVCKNSITHYPSNHKPMHLLPDNIVNKASLTTDKFLEPKRVVSVHTQINTTTFKPIGKPMLRFQIGNVSNKCRYTYESAAAFLNEYSMESFDINQINTLAMNKRNVLIINLAYTISQSMKSSRITIGKKLDHYNTNIKYIRGNTPVFYTDNDNVKNMKETIAEFAIFANTFIGEYLNKHGVKDKTLLGIYRTCDASELKNMEHATSDQVMDAIVKKGVSATYTQTNDSHDLVGSRTYTHFTSPIRRASDCICHFLLKYIYFKKNNFIIKPPFTEQFLINITNHIDSQTKLSRKLQHIDTKFRSIQALAYLVSLYNKADLEVKFNNSSGPLFNLTIKKINQFNVSISYTVRVVNYTSKGIELLKQHSDDNYIKLHIDTVNIPGKFDTNTLPELDKYLQILCNKV